MDHASAANKRQRSDSSSPEEVSYKAQSKRGKAASTLEGEAEPDCDQIETTHLEEERRITPQEDSTDIAIDNLLDRLPSSYVAEVKAAMKSGRQN